MRLDVQPHAPPGALDAAFDQRADAELARDLAHRPVGVAVPLHAGPGDHREPGHARKLREQVVVQPGRQGPRVLHPAQDLERQDGDVPRVRSRRGVSRPADEIGLRRREVPREPVDRRSRGSVRSRPSTSIRRERPARPTARGPGGLAVRRRPAHALRPHLERPREDHHDRKPEDDEGEKELVGPVREPGGRDDRVDELERARSRDQVDGRDAVHLPALQLDEEAPQSSDRITHPWHRHPAARQRSGRTSPPVQPVSAPERIRLRTRCCGSIGTGCADPTPA